MQRTKLNLKNSLVAVVQWTSEAGKIEVVRILLEANINVELRDQDDKTVLTLMDELKTPMAKEIIHVILGELI